MGNLSKFGIGNQKVDSTTTQHGKSSLNADQLLKTSALFTPNNPGEMGTFSSIELPQSPLYLNEEQAKTLEHIKMQTADLVKTTERGMKAIKEINNNDLRIKQSHHKLREAAAVNTEEQYKLDADFAQQLGEQSVTYNKIFGETDGQINAANNAIEALKSVNQKANSFAW